MGDPDQGMPRVTSGAQAQYERGLDHMRNGDVAAAGREFQSAADAGHPGAWREIGMAAIDDLGPLAIATSPLFERGAGGGDGRSMAYLGGFRRVNDNPAGAMEFYRAADAAGDPEGSRELGIMLAKTGDVRGAQAALDRSIDRGSASGMLALGILLKNEVGDLAGAEDAFRRAATMGHPKGPLNLFSIYMARGDTSAAEIERERALELAREHESFLESIEGPDALNRVKAAVSTTSVAATSGSSCLVSLTVLIAAVGVTSGLFGLLPVG
jgi:TPR repeat protein